MTDSSEKKGKGKNSIKRREFCKAVPCAFFGGFYLFSQGGECAVTSFQKENVMAKKIIAVEAKVISQKGTCGLDHKPGDVARFTESGVEGKLCIHALYSMMPGVFAMMYDAQFPWLKDPEKKTHACPDAYNPVVFEIKKIREK
jgi:uncharacterized repeat protein (TIGR04076 family)